VQVLLRWGDPLFPDAPEFDPLAQTPDKQRRQFGYNSDYVGYIPISGSSERGLWW
jgi:secreted PhoX family phosphatase